MIQGVIVVMTESFFIKMTFNDETNSSLQILECLQVPHSSSTDEGRILHAIQGERGAHMCEAFLMGMSCSVTWCAIKIFTFWTIKDGSLFFTKGTIYTKEHKAEERCQQHPYG